jgi:hypothetical protein
MSDDDDNDIQGASSSFSWAVVVTAAIVNEAYQAGDLESLRQWASQGVHATAAPFGGALRDAATNYNLDMVRCMVEFGAYVNYAMWTGETPLIIASTFGCLEIARCLVDHGALVGQADYEGDTALLKSANYGHYKTTQYLLEHAGANFEDVDNLGIAVWDSLTNYLSTDEDKVDRDEDDPAALIALLWVMSLRSAPPPALVALLSPEPVRIVQEGALL